jgi:hypothetical protein
MIFGWGLWPDSWFLMIIGYFIAALAWPFSVWSGKRWAKSFFMISEVDE